MPSEDEHRLQAEHNQAFMDSLDRKRFPDWLATAAFYKGVHLVQILFVKKGHPTGSHQKRNTTLKTTYPELWKAYRPLYTFSRLTRYRCYLATQDDLV